MEKKIKNYLGIAGIIAILVIAGSAWSYANSYAKQIDPSSIRSFSVSGEGKVVSVPDVASFTFSVITEGGTNVASLQKTNVEKTNGAVAFLKEKGIDEKDIRTESYNVEPRYQYYSCGKYDVSSSREVCPPAEIVGYTIRQTVSVKVRNFEVIGDVLSGVVEKGANSTSALQFTIDDPTEAKGLAREQAIEKAKDKAKAIAKAGGFSIGKLISINEGTLYASDRNYYKTAMEESYGVGGGAVPAAANIQVGSEDVSVSVTLIYEIK